MSHLGNATVQINALIPCPMEDAISRSEICTRMLWRPTLSAFVDAEITDPIHYGSLSHSKPPSSPHQCSNGVYATLCPSSVVSVVVVYRLSNSAAFEGVCPHCQHDLLPRPQSSKSLNLRATKGCRHAKEAVAWGRGDDLVGVDWCDDDAGASEGCAEGGDECGWPHFSFFPSF